MNTNSDFYQVLQVGFGAEKADIVAAYRRLCKLYHPDVSRLPHAQERMTQINLAYATLSNDTKRQAYNNTLSLQGSSSTEKAAAEAADTITEYFTQLLHGEYDKAHQLLCASDRQRVSVRSFVEWRQAVQELYGIREFKINRGQHMAGFRLEKNRSVSAIRFFVDVLERDHASGRQEHYCFTKYVVFEQGQPGVYLGYRDLSEISKTFGSWAREREQVLMQQHWQEHVQHYDRATGLLTREGLLAESKRELYRAQRYKRPLTVAVLSLKPAFSAREPLSPACLEAAAQALKRSLRQTDMTAYVGNGVFLVLFFELKKRHASLIVERMLKKAEQAARIHNNGGISSAFAFETYASGSLDPYVQRLCSRINLK